MAQTDEQLIELCKNGDLSALEELLNQYRNPLMAFICSVVRDYHLAEDIFQETFIRIYREARRFRSGAGFKTWLYAIAMNRCRDALRKSRRKPTLSLETEIKGPDGVPVGRMIETVGGEGPGPREEAGGRELEAIFRRKLAGLSEEHRQVVIMNRLSGLKYREIARILGIPSGTVRSRLHYALEHLRKKMFTGEDHNEM
ncbi:MAG: RNA polymerase sigma factor [Candidatus Euphemobacter frigidus]|nr:RNA polymerase sigma factor [Candidatus Euphemobacter frigidus]MDP8276715.1 RNA polymerase sigma factor [Candidatus Euphemobacter frigidus]